MTVQSLHVISDVDIQRIHTASLDILSNVGIQIHHGEALRSLENAGALVDHSKQLVKMPPNLVEECIKKTPKSYTLAGRSPKADLKIEPDKTYTRCASGSLYLIDSETKKRRKATRKT